MDYDSVFHFLSKKLSSNFSLELHFSGKMLNFGDFGKILQKLRKLGKNVNLLSFYCQRVCLIVVKYSPVRLQTIWACFLETFHVED